MSDQISKQFFIRGRVQGVCFRTFTKRKAKELKLNGWTRNLLDGRVEVIASGNKTAIYSFIKWLKTGPDLAEVTEIQEYSYPRLVDEGFKIY